MTPPLPPSPAPAAVLNDAVLNDAVLDCAVLAYADDEVEVFHRPGRSAFTLVTFAGRDMPANGHDFWRRAQAAALDLDCLGFVARRANWYPTAALRQAALAVAGLGQRLRLGYGKGMGGHAVLKHGRLLGLQHALAVRPVFAGSGGFAAGERPPRHGLPPALATQMVLHHRDLPPWSAAVLDPYTGPEREHAARLAALGVRVVVAPFMAERAALLLGGSQRPVLAALEAGDATALRHLLRRRRKASAVWYGRMAGQAEQHGHTALAARLRARQERIKG
ncbi:hypothetical protein NON00_06685 [Roseomonas sp. GC11]|uniref:hypothetical protein n=1 Tax=Roseomonas sp. GC11 TaxID=2950546 RepID=UPI00210DE367|nr:hypothetical protein [Roseomonas sp. GC11]MCQ4159608.1 hypothetical protein [Roseomonas sp. GC11]